MNDVVTDQFNVLGSRLCFVERERTFFVEAKWGKENEEMRLFGIASALGASREGNGRGEEG